MIALPFLLALASPPACVEIPAEGQRVGAASATSTVEVFLDPASSQTARAWMELRRLVAEHAGELALQVHWVGRGGITSPMALRVRAFVTSLAARGHTTSALRVVARDGLERLHARLVDPDSHEALAKELRVSADVLKAALDDRCARQAVIEQTERLNELRAPEGGSVLRLPAFALDGLLFDDGPALDRLRPEIGRAGMRRRLREDPPRSPSTPAVQTTSERMQRPPLKGLLLGGPGLPHRMVLMARDETDPTLFVALPPSLAQRRLQPGTLAVHVVARGVSSAAETLRHRLCAARELGLGNAYVEYLGRDPALRGEDNPLDESLLADLDAVPVEECKDDPDPVDLDLPDGSWLDGLPRSRAELGNLRVTLPRLDAATRPLRSLFIAVDDL
ncbi:MAG: hypothetical protein AAF799_40575 [Myxococcota bacterium]